MAARKTTPKPSPAKSSTRAKSKPSTASRAKPSARKSRAAKPQEDSEFRALGARVVSIFGPFSSRVLIEMPAAGARMLFGEPLEACGRTAVSESVAREFAELRKRAPAIADSTLAATAAALALELDNPFNSATSKSMCAKALMEALEQLRELAPPPQEKDKVDDLAAKRAARLSHLVSGGAGAATSPGS